MGEDPNSNSPLWLPRKDKSGKVLKKNLANAALKNWDRMRDHAAREHVDSSFAADIVESIVKSSSAARCHSGDGEIRNPESYIMARFMRRIKRLLVKERRVEYFASLKDLESLRATQDWEWPLRLENAIQVKEIISYMDRDTRWTYWSRVQGLSWKEIARRQGVRVNTAIKAYERGLQRTRERMRLAPGSKHDS